MSMKCRHHPRNDAVGYCMVCGDVGCRDCLNEHENAWYCAKHFKPIAEEMKRKQRIEENLAKRDRQRLVVHTKTGETAYGYCHSLNMESDGFHFEMVNKNGEPLGKTAYIHFADLKAVFYVKSYDGKFDSKMQTKRWSITGTPIVVEFEDGEILHGHTLHPYQKNEPRFFVIPDDTESNNISVLLETSYVQALYTPEEYKAKHQSEINDFLEENLQEGVCREEGIGDYYFTRHHYVRAMKNYLAALNENPGDMTIRDKIHSAEYNIAVRYIKRRDYKHAMARLRHILEANPEHEKAKAAMTQIRAHIQKKKAIKRTIATPNQ